MKSITSTAKMLTAAKYGAAGLIAGSSALSCVSAHADKPPNIILIVADDLGWTGIKTHEGDCSGYGDNCTCNDSASKWDSQFYRTPRIKSLREAGMRFMRAYSCPSSKATRAALMTGKYPRRCVNYQFNIPLCETTIPEAIDAAVSDYDYVSAISGKWHNSYSGAKPHPRHFDPFRQGFDYQYGASWMAMGNLTTRLVTCTTAEDEEDYWEPDPTTFGSNWHGPLDGGWYQEEADKNAVPPGIGGLYFPGLGDPNPYGYWDPDTAATDPNREFISDAVATRAIEFMQTTTDSSHPNYDKPFFLYVPFFAPHRPWHTNIKQANSDPYPEYTGTDSRHTEGPFSYTNAYGYTITIDPNDYARLTQKLDDNVGRILDAVEQVDPNAIIIFYSDNGAPTGFLNANVSSNYPLNSGKGTHYEGGIRVPLIVKWPGVTDVNSICNEPVHVCDFLPTIVNMAAGDSFKSENLPLIDGQSFVPLLEQPDGSTFTRDNNCFYVLSEGGTLENVIYGTGTINNVECDGYKLIKSTTSETYQLYDLDNCLSENEPNEILDNNPSQLEQQIADAMKYELESWLDSQKVYIIDGDPNGYDTIQLAVDTASSSGDTIVIPPRTFFEVVRLGGGNPTYNKSITLRSIDPNDPRIVASTIINASGYPGAFRFNSTAACTLQGLTLTGGYSTSTSTTPTSFDFGGGISCIDSASDLSVIDRCVICYNDVKGDGAGIYNFDGTITNCTFYNNTAQANGGALASCGGTIKNCLIYANAADKGGAFDNCDGTIANCTITGNIAVTQGGGLYGCNGTIRNCIFAHNTSHAIYEEVSPDPNVQYCLFYKNPDGDWYDSETSSSLTGAPNINGLQEAENNIADNDNYLPAFEKCFDFVDHIRDAPWSTDWQDDKTTIPVDIAEIYDVNDIIEFNNDRVIRRVTTIDTTTDDNKITFTPAYLMEDNISSAFGTPDDMRHLTVPSKYVVLYNWGNYQNVTSIIEDFHLLNTSACINTGDDTAVTSGDTDMDGNERKYADQVDIGADEAIHLAKLMRGTTLIGWYFNVQDAIDDTVADDVVTVYPGIYKESLNFTNRSIEVQGSDPNDWDVIETTIIDPNAVLP